MGVIPSINNKNFTDFGIYVSAYNGFLDVPKRKDIQKFNWPNYHGISADLSQVIYDVRELELQCFIRANSWQSLIENYNNFMLGELGKTGSQRLKIQPFNAKTLAYEVFLEDEVNGEKRFQSGESFGKFNLKLIEANPIKRVLQLPAATNSLTLSLTTTKEVEIFFGDGTMISAKGSISLTKNYASTTELSVGNYTLKNTINRFSMSGKQKEIIIAGDLEDIKNLTSNATTLWNKL